MKSQTASLAWAIGKNWTGTEFWGDSVRVLTPFGMAPTRKQCPFMCTRDVQVLGQNWSSEVIYMLAV